MIFGNFGWQIRLHTVKFRRSGGVILLPSRVKNSHLLVNFNTYTTMAEKITEIWSIQSTVNNTATRMAQVIHIANLVALTRSTRELAIRFIASPDHPITMKEYSLFAERATLFREGGSATLSFDNDSSLGQNIRLSIGIRE